MCHPPSIAFKCAYCGKVFNIETDHTQDRGQSAPLSHACFNPPNELFNSLSCKSGGCKKRFNAEEKLVQHKGADGTLPILPLLSNA